MSEARVHGDLRVLSDQRIAVVGYGNLGRPAALNLRDAGLDVVVGSRGSSAAADQAAAEGFEVVPVDEALSTAAVIWLTIPDEIVPSVLAPTGAAHPSPGSMICLSSGYTLAYGLLKPPEDVDVVMLAPRMIGIRIRQLYEAGGGFHSFIAVDQDATGTAHERLLALAEAFGTLRVGALEMPPATEAALDLFVEQTLGPYLGAALLTAFEVGTAKGLPPEALALELYLSREMAATWDSFAENGFFGGVRLHGHSASFGGYLRMGDIDVEAMKAQFAAIYEEIASGAFARRFQDELDAGSPIRELIDAMASGDDPLTRAEATVRLPKEG